MPKINKVDDIYENIAEYNPNKERNRLIVFDVMVDDMQRFKTSTNSNRKFIRGRKLNSSLVFITQFYFAVPKTITLKSTLYFIMKILKS